MILDLLMIIKFINYYTENAEVGKASKNSLHG